eukprot:Plantae.Rhodophyta-Purpureofilum_apyrenoidigerum.ctg2510.p2 GENE.Plantae.Rhodophyta-Purpureofilum_apyrenoidigerum.ctg2510~~Plantae.Rhodophyta-Purpureofilum_apyrenoidigerum.ctg2510.p2  ORF type:complete len:178 (+),score=28.79 Plantae.Rhodophyta-Purpureofilum_apyrenoidigerum.ctg2510:562-1095(+)
MSLRYGYACPVAECDASLLSKQNLREHGRIHTKEVPYECKFPSCKMRFKWRSSVAHHVKKMHKSARSLGAAQTELSRPQSEDVPLRQNPLEEVTSVPGRKRNGTEPVRLAHTVEFGRKLCSSYDESFLSFSPEFDFVNVVDKSLPIEDEYTSPDSFSLSDSVSQTTRPCDQELQQLI